ncbi:uncharacterized protein LOC116022518 isoform X2 [Ipomoea triloba]|nr:uncharacterized protein LOC116022518 isoform X2 [Ipomoea triloba]XP_031119111.1 uncharacterized protein LOC116022518 isoform X2 [Ipomoea triloba]XP_031119112.1 uncharacterized protein LOC116022518 isoform X2 [Ipomoea triloba]XP_031119113.1 uncharacterized protein LOC116022518 isoform X2 [Ipomoea triloba]XP_031119114.1 uncharacterized protein LOC116022518 isoform X2 [Ipomoea triloba]
MHSQEESDSEELRNCSEMEGGPDPGISFERENKMNLEVLDIEPSHTEAEIFEASNDPFSECEDYLLGVIQETECWSDLLEMTNHELSNNKFEDKMLVDDNCLSFPTSFTSGDIDYLENVSSFLPGSISSDNNDEDAIFTPALTSSGSICMSTIKQNKELSIGGPNVDHESLYLQDSSTKNSSQDSNCNGVHTQKRVRKPTRRYIDESVDLINTRRNKKKLEVSTSLSKDKCYRVKCSKKHNKPLELEFQPEETLCEAIQVPFGPLVPEECHIKHPSSVVKVKPNEIPLCGNKDGDKKHASDVKKVKLNQLPSFSPENCCQRYELDVHKVKLNKTVKAKHMSGFEECDGKHTSNVNKANQNHILPFGSKEYLNSPACDVNKVLKSDDENEMLMDESDDGVVTLRSDGDGARRKHHRLWTVSEVRELIDGVSQCGVGRWSQIKRLFFSSSDHRTPVDLKDKWRNLLKATHLQNQSSKKAGKGKQSFSWRPLPKPILHRVVELASVHPYPRNCRSKTPHSY